MSNLEQEFVSVISQVSKEITEDVVKKTVLPSVTALRENVDKTGRDAANFTNAFQKDLTGLKSGTLQVTEELNQICAKYGKELDSILGVMLDKYNEKIPHLATEISQRVVQETALQAVKQLNQEIAAFQEHYQGNVKATDDMYNRCHEVLAKITVDTEKFFKDQLANLSESLQTSQGELGELEKALKKSSSDVANINQANEKVLEQYRDVTDKVDAACQDVIKHFKENVDASKEDLNRVSLETEEKLQDFQKAMAGWGKAKVAYLARLQKIEQENSGFIERTEQKIANNISEFGKTITDNGQQVQATMQTAIDHLGETLQSGMNSSHEVIGDALREQLQKQIEVLHLKTEANTKELKNSVNGSIQAISKENAAMKKQVLSALVQQNEKITDVANKQDAKRRQLETSLNGRITALDNKLDKVSRELNTKIDHQMGEVRELLLHTNEMLEKISSSKTIRWFS